MVLVDYSHLSMRALYVAISQSRPSKTDGQYNTDEFISFYYHVILTSLRHISKKFKDYGDIVLALDSRMNWRKDVYSGYKAHRKKDRDKSDVNFEEFFSHVKEFTKILDESFPYKVIEVETAEADDVIGVLAKKYTPTEKVMVVSSDKDFKQILEFGAELYDPIKKIFIRMTKEELKTWKMVHILCGDESDGVPHIKRETEFTENFLSYLKNNDIYIKTPEEFNELSISEKLYSEFDVHKVNKKNEIQEELDIFKTTPFGPKTAEKFVVDLKENLSKNKLYAKHFKRNMELVLFDKIPENIKEKILNDFDKIEFQYDANGIMQFISKHNLTQHLMNITDFYVDGKKGFDRSIGLSEWV